MTLVKTYPPISRVDIAWTCVATDDPSPLHLDEPFATALGHPSVMAPGTMLLGWTGELLERIAGSPQALVSWTIRFVRPVWPGDQLTIGPADAASGETSLIATRADGTVVARVQYRVDQAAVKERNDKDDE
ncbi:MAG: MaoC family protein [Subtercola sp.]|nr:MaoC family protein [Subtercola sp.]